MKAFQAVIVGRCNKCAIINLLRCDQLQQIYANARKKLYQLVQDFVEILLLAIAVHIVKLQNTRIYHGSICLA